MEDPAPWQGAATTLPSTIGRTPSDPLNYKMVNKALEFFESLQRERAAGESSGRPN